MSILQLAIYLTNPQTRVLSISTQLQQSEPLVVSSIFRVMVCRYIIVDPGGSPSIHAILPNTSSKNSCILIDLLKKKGKTSVPQTTTS